MCVHSLAEWDQPQQRLLGGLGRELRQRLHQLVHHHAQVGLQLFPPFLHKLGILEAHTHTHTHTHSHRGLFLFPFNFMPHILAVPETSH